MGFVDTGIDYRLDCFRNSDGTSRIVSIWDQSLQSADSPFDLHYGTEYTKEQIDLALSSRIRSRSFLPRTRTVTARFLPYRRRIGKCAGRFHRGRPQKLHRRRQA